MAKKKALPKVTETKRDPSAREKAVIADAHARGNGRRKRVQVAPHPDSPAGVSNPHSDGEGFQAALLDTFGTTSMSFVDRSVWQLSKALNRAGVSNVESLNAGLAAIAGIRPANETEAMLAVQMAATHEAALAMLDIAKSNSTVPALQAAGGLAVRLLRTYAAQIEALHKIRRGGEQTVRVEHVNVYPGGQAIVGSVSHGGGGGAGETRHQPHAQRLSHAPVATLRSEDEEREPVQVSGDD